NPTRITDPLNRVTTVTYDKYGNARTMTAPDPDGAGPKTSPVSTNTYDRGGENLTATDPTGAQTVLTYDYLGRPATSAVSDRDTGQTVFFTTTYGYDAAGDLSKVTSPLSHSTMLTYNPAGEPTKVEDSTGRFVQLGYDLAGRRTSTAVGTGVACANFGPTCP